MDQPVISVAMIAYNARQFIRESMESALAQSFRDFELIVVDDGSTDGTGEVIAEVARGDARVRVHCFDRNRGIAAARSCTLDMARGEYFAILDSDDLNRPDRLEKELSFLRSHPDIALCGSNLTIIDAEGNMIGRRRYPEYGREMRRAALKTLPLHNSASMTRTAVLRSVGGYGSSDLAEDYDLFLRVMARYESYNIQDDLACYRISENQCIQKSLKPVLRSAQRVRWQWLFHPRFRSAYGFAWFTAMAILKFMPNRLVFMLYQKTMLNTHKHSAEHQIARAEPSPETRS